ncbi:MAG: hypothetical protein KJ955_08655 [Nanoarchaeota archaeon]|nr:hypothetical protein [Nanoarchaeota archaeon]
MLQIHYNIPKGSFNTILESIINHLTPKGRSEYERVAETEDALEEMIKQDATRVYSERLMTDIQITRFFWDFLGRPIEKAGYLPERIEGDELNSSQPALQEDLELITAYPTTPAFEVADKMIEKMVGNFTGFGVAVATRRNKEMPDLEYKRIK